MNWLGKKGEDKKPNAREKKRAIQIQRAQHLTKSIEPENFRMYLAESVGGSEHAVHEFTTAQTRSLIRVPDLRVNEHELQRDYPSLYSLWQQKEIGGSVLMAQCSVNWKKERPTVESKAQGDGQPRQSKQLHLSIQNTFQIRNGSLPPRCYSVVKYFMNGELITTNGPQRVWEVADDSVQASGRTLLDVKLGSVSISSGATKDSAYRVPGILGQDFPGLVARLRHGQEQGRTERRQRRRCRGRTQNGQHKQRAHFAHHSFA